MLTMLIGGLWHGANWTFVVWGAYHGALLILFHWSSAHWQRFPRLLRQLGTFGLVIIGWVFFRATDLTMATEILGRMFLPRPGVVVGDLTAWAIALAIATYWAMAGPNANDVHANFRWRPLIGLAWAVAFGVCLSLIGGSRSSPFLYFQF